MHSIFYKVIDSWDKNPWELIRHDQKENVFQMNVFDPTLKYGDVVLIRKIFHQALQELQENENIVRLSVITEYCEQSFMNEKFGFLCYQNNQNIHTNTKIGQRINIKFSLEFKSTLTAKINSFLTSLTEPLFNTERFQILNPLSLESQSQIDVKICYDYSNAFPYDYSKKQSLRNIYLFFAAKTQEAHWKAAFSHEEVEDIIIDDVTEQELIKIGIENYTVNNSLYTHYYFKFSGCELYIAKLFKTILTYQIHPFTYQFIDNLHSFARLNQLCNLNFEYK